MSLQCEYSAPAITIEAIRHLEAQWNLRFPDTFFAHYLHHNRGVPTQAYWLDEQDCFEPIEIAHFIPIAPIGANADPLTGTLEQCHHTMVTHQLIPPHWIPFGRDFGGNLFCWDSQRHEILFVTTDSWREELSAAENQYQNQRRLTDDFQRFIDRARH